MRFRSQLEKDEHSDIYHWYFPVPEELVQELTDKNSKRVVCTVNSEVRYHCAIHGDGTGGFRILLNRERCKKLGLVRGETIDVELEQDTSDYGMEMSEELREVLDQNPEADRIFHGLTKGMQRTIIYWVDNVKSAEIRIRRAIVMSDHIVAQNGKPDHKLLNMEIKAANQAAKRG